MIYAPIVIPTLNRIEHLKRCIESLQNNLWAQYTPLIISVDYPPNEKYDEGYHKVCKYLEKGIDGFYSVKIIFQNRNLGAYRNKIFLREQIEQNYDRYIFTEDDNEFSPNFIEYIDKGLDLFKNDEDVMAICSNGSPTFEEEDNNIVLSQNYTAYGCGLWVNKEKKLQELMNRDYLWRIVGNTEFLLELARKQAGLLFSLQSAALQKEELYRMPGNEVPIIDQTVKIYLIAEHKYVIGACIRKGRTWGMDGSGLNSPKNDKYDAKKVEIDVRNYFDYHYTIPMKKNEMRAKHSFEITCRIVAAIIKLKIWRLKVGMEKNDMVVS